jgi:hypothetical protein
MQHQPGTKVEPNLIGVRLKQTWAKWKLERLNRMTVLCSSRYSDHWEDYWNNAK